MRRGAPLGALAILAAVLILALSLVPAAFAGPPGPTMDLAQLSAALESGPLDGYLLTTMAGSTPEEIPLQVQSLVVYSDGTLILFEARGPVIDKLGSIAAGMSGSPVYVTVGSADYLVGALSYGNEFTRGGTGLATPIEYMAAIQDTYPVSTVGAVTHAAQTAAPKPGTYSLTTPVTTKDGVVRRVTIAKSVAAGRKLAATTQQPVMSPLGIIEIGGVRPDSAAFKRVAAQFEGTGMLVKAASGDGEWAGAATPALTGGSPCVMLFSQGAVWVGAGGTVTYVDGDTAMIFGHPFQQFGPIDAILTGGSVEGSWPSNAVPYKMIAPRDVKGTLVQDRAWGVEGHLGASATLFPVHTEVTYGGRSVTDHSTVDQWLVSSQMYPSLPGEIAANVTYRLVDQVMLPGSATTATTVVLSDSTGTYTVDRQDLWSDAYDIIGYAGLDAAAVLDQVSADPDGVLQARVDSVTVHADISQTRLSARIASVDVPDGLKTGANTVVISYYTYGSATLKTLTATLTIPKGDPLTGRLLVAPGQYSEGPELEGEDEGGSTSGGAPQTLAQLVDAINSAPLNSDLVISYSSPANAVSVTAPTGYVFSRPISATTTDLRLTTLSRSVSYGGTAMVAGELTSSVDVPVRVYLQAAGQEDPILVTTVTARASQGVATFSAEVPGLRKTSTIIAVASGGDGTLTARGTVRIAVKAWVRLGGGSPLRVKVEPAASGVAKIQLKSGRRWLPLRTVRVVDGKGAVKLPAGTWTVRAVFPKTSVCAAGTSRALTVTVR